MSFSEAIALFAKWSDTWQLNLAPHKCVVLTLGKISPPIYILNDNHLPIVDHITDLGISFNNLLSFDMHFINICRKSYALVNQIFRIFQSNSAYFLILAFKSYVLPILEYCCSLWSPGKNQKRHLSNIDRIESVQRYFTRRLFSRCYNNNRYITKKSHLYISYESRLELFKLDPLELRRLRYDLALIYQISNNLTAVDRDDILFISTPNNTR